MKAEIGLWIDHREAIIVVLSEAGEEIRRILSTAEKQLRRSSEPSNGSHEAQDVPADDSREREYTGHLAHYYDEIISCVRAAGSILIFGPGEAKEELKKRVEKDKSDTRIVAVETADKMTDPQIVAKVRQYFHQDAGSGGARKQRGKGC
jgi:stalled ribosome rescue protein Dom34